jgi:AbiV family abortive infection protein
MMSKRSLPKKPVPHIFLFKYLFNGRASDESFRLLAEGISACRQNAERLLSDVKLLVRNGRFASARFLLTTAREEIAKSYILVDMCRLDLGKHASVLRSLCKAFYDHISKHAYVKLHEASYDSMSDAKQVWEAETQRWWPGDEETPDMPHDTALNRELPLYVSYVPNYADYIEEDDSSWSVPSDSDHSLYFDPEWYMRGATPVALTEKLIDAWRQTDKNGLCSSQVLAILNDIFKLHYIQKNTTWEQINKLYKQVAARIAKETGIAEEKFLAAPFVGWPLYPFVSKC